jgi:hypothetical protein
MQGFKFVAGVADTMIKSSAQTPISPTAFLNIYSSQRSGHCAHCDGKLDEGKRGARDAARRTHTTSGPLTHERRNTEQEAREAGYDKTRDTTIAPPVWRGAWSVLAWWHQELAEDFRCVVLGR